MSFDLTQQSGGVPGQFVVLTFNKSPSSAEWSVRDLMILHCLGTEDTTTLPPPTTTRQTTTRLPPTTSRQTTGQPESTTASSRTTTTPGGEKTTEASTPEM